MLGKLKKNITFFSTICYRIITRYIESLQKDIYKNPGCASSGSLTSLKRMLLCYTTWKIPKFQVKRNFATWTRCGKNGPDNMAHFFFGGGDADDYFY